MKLTRIETAKLKAAIVTAEKSLDVALKSLESFLPLLTEEERRQSLKPRTGFSDIARKLDALLAIHDALAKAVGYEHDAVMEDLDNAEAIVGLIDRTERLSQLLSDAKLAWLSQAMYRTIPSYHAARAHAKFDGSLAKRLEPIQEFYAHRRKGKDKDKEKEKTDELIQ